MAPRIPRPTQTRALRYLLCLSALVLLLPAGVAHAAPYSVYSCIGPADQPLPNSAWLTSVVKPVQTPNFQFGTSCGALSVSATSAINYEAGDGGAHVFDPPAGTTISGYRIVRSADVQFLSASPLPAVSAGIRESSSGGDVDRDCAAVIDNCAIPSAAVVRSGLALTRLALAVHCVAAPSCPSGRWYSLTTTLESARVDLEDPTVPEVTAVTGTLPGSDAAAGMRTVQATTTDVGGGVARVELSIDGALTRSVSAGGNCATPYTTRQPCPSGLLADFGIDTSALTNGVHVGSVRAIDAAGSAGGSEAFLFTVSTGGTDPAVVAPNNGVPAVERPQIRALAGPASVSGALSTGTTAIRGARLEVSSLDLGVFGAQPVALGEVTTGDDGTFTVPVRPSGAIRISVAYRPSPGAAVTADTSAVVRQRLRLSIKRSKFRVKPGGALMLSGRLSGAGAAAAGAPVEIDVRIKGRWRAVGVVEANSRGNYRWRYRFTRVKQATKFVFRAQVRKNRSWPWPTEHSRQVKVLVAR